MGRFRVPRKQKADRSFQTANGSRVASVSLASAANCRLLSAVFTAVFVLFLFPRFAIHWAA